MADEMIKPEDDERELPGGEAFREQMNTLACSEQQLAAVGDYLDTLAEHMDRLPANRSAPALERAL